MGLYVIIEYDKVCDVTIIGVCDNVERTHKLIDKYYLTYDEKDFKDVRDSGIEYIKTIEWYDNIMNEYETLEIVVHEYQLNEL